MLAEPCDVHMALLQLATLDAPHPGLTQESSLGQSGALGREG